MARGDDDWSARTIAAGDTRYRVVAVPTEKGQALVIAQSLESAGADAGQARRRDAAVRRSPAWSPPGWPAGRSPATACARCAGSPRRSRRSPAPRTCTPLPVEGDDEIARLATAFNQMLTALAASRDRQRQLVADAGHELRTPLTSLRTNLDLLVAGRRQRAAALLPRGPRRAARRRTRPDRGAHHPDRRPRRARPRRAAHPCRGAGRPRRGRGPGADPGPPPRARARLRRRRRVVVGGRRARGPGARGHQPARQRRQVEPRRRRPSRSGSSEGVLTVDDEGPGISERDLPHVFDRFYRAEESRSMPGSGLGPVDRAAGRRAARRHRRGGAPGRAAARGSRSGCRAHRPSRTSRSRHRASHPRRPAVRAAPCEYEYYRRQTRVCGL